MHGWEDLYRLICNTTGTEKRRRCTISAMHKIDIALQMQGDADWHYKFRPQHIIHDELCMVLQEKAFSLIQAGEATELPLDAYNPRSPTQVLVREIAFGKYLANVMLTLFSGTVTITYPFFIFSRSR